MSEVDPVRKPSGGLTRRQIVAGGGGLAVGLAGGLGIGAAAFGSDDEPASAATSGGPSGPPVKIGNSVPLTGAFAADGQDMKRGYELAVEEINALGGIAGRPVELSLLDAGDYAPDVMVNNFKRLVTDEKVDAIIGGYQVASGPEFDIVAQAEAIYIHNNTLESSAQQVANDPEKYWGIFQHDPTEVWYSRTFLEFIETLHAAGHVPNQNVAMINADGAYSEGLTKEFRRIIEGTPWKLTLVETVKTPNTQWGATLAKIRREQPGVIWMTDYLVGDGASFMQQFVQNPTQSIVHVQYAPSVPEFLDLAEGAADGVSWATVIGILQDDIGKAWTSSYQEKFGETPGYTQGAAAYDATKMYANAAALAGGPEDRRKIAELLRTVPYRGVAGSRYLNHPDQTARPYPAFTRDGSLAIPTQYFQVQGGEQVVVYPEPFSEQGAYQAPPWLT